MSQLSQTVANVIRLIALLVACFASAFTPTAIALGNPIGETVYIGYDATVVYDGSQNSSSAYEDAARPPTAEEKHDSGAARTLLSRIADLVAAEAEVQVTKSNLQLGQQMHSAYKADAVNGVTTFKEFRLPSGKRIDFLDIENGLIHELKPNNPRAIKAGMKQLEIYKNELQSLPEYQGMDWQTILDTY